jgi:hypothetical protein
MAKIWRHQEIEGAIVAVQDRVVGTNYFKNLILKEEIYSKCQLCKQHEYNIHHLSSGCPSLASSKK